MARKKVLITGAAGRIGRVLHQGLKDRYDLRLLYHNTVPPPEPGEDRHIADIQDLEAMVEAAAGMDAIVHMAGNPSGSAPFEAILEQNLRGVYTIYEAARQTGAKRVVFASTNHVTGHYEKNGIYTTPDMPARPDSFYGASKAFGEDLGRYYVDAHGLSVICIRIGSFQPPEAVRNRKGDRILSSWLSHRDTVQLVWRAIEAEHIRFGVYYGISGNTRAYWPIRNAREDLGYEPEDNAEDHVQRMARRTRPQVHRLANRVVGYHRRLVEDSVAAGVDCVSFGDDWGAQRSLLISPEMWRRFFKPRYVRLFEPARDAGVHIWFHTDGWTLEILDDLIDLGVTILNPQHHCMGDEVVARKIAGRVCLRSDLDRQCIIPFGTPQEIEDHVQDIIRLFDTYDGGLILHGEVGPDVPFDNIETLYGAYLKFGRYPLGWL